MVQKQVALQGQKVVRTFSREKEDYGKFDPTQKIPQFSIRGIRGHTPVPISHFPRSITKGLRREDVNAYNR
jgi:hypothetical protein